MTYLIVGSERGEPRTCPACGTVLFHRLEGKPAAAGFDPHWVRHPDGTMVRHHRLRRPKVPAPLWTGEGYVPDPDQRMAPGSLEPFPVRVRCRCYRVTTFST